MFRAGLADKSLHVDQTGRDDIARAIDDTCIGGNGLRRHIAPRSDDIAVAHENAAARLRPARGIDEPRVDERYGLEGLERHGLFHQLMLRRPPGATGAPARRGRSRRDR